MTNMDCLFCKIVKGEIPSTKIFESDKTLAFLDINPLTKGHCLVMPKDHHENVFDIPLEDLKILITDAKQLADVLRGSLEADGINLINASGVAAEQSVFHFHIHIVPRYDDDGLQMNQWWQTKTKPVSLEELKKLAEEIQDK